MNIIHFGIHNSENGNSGDTVLFKLTQKLFSSYNTNIKWTNKNLWELINIDEVNSHDMLLIGGGGLMLKDQKGAEKSLSGWQFNCSSELIDMISIPIVVFGIGYNRFRRQEEFDSNFKDTINKLVKKSIFFGLRNSGSLKKLTQYIENDFHEKLSIQSCPTVIHDMIEETNHSKLKVSKQKISFNFAYDRPHFRFLNEKKVIENLVKFLLWINKEKYDVSICLHKKLDLKIMDYIPKSEQNNFNIVDISSSNYENIVQYYLSIDLSIGMRGHSQMIPFGLCKNIISIISHDKMKYFLEDNNLVDYGVDLDEPEVFENLKKTFNLYENKKNDQLKIIKKRKQLILRQTNSNLQNIFSHYEK